MEATRLICSFWLVMAAGLGGSDLDGVPAGRRLTSVGVGWLVVTPVNAEGVEVSMTE